MFVRGTGEPAGSLMERHHYRHCTFFPLLPSGPAFIPYLDSLPAMSREETGPFRMPIVDKYKVCGCVCGCVNLNSKRTSVFIAYQCIQ